MAEEGQKQERFVLVPRGSRYAIERQVPAEGFDPPLWITAEELGRFRDREEARQFMLARSEQGPPDA